MFSFARKKKIYLSSSTYRPIRQPRRILWGRRGPPPRVHVVAPWCPRRQKSRTCSTVTQYQPWTRCGRERTPQKHRCFSSCVLLCSRGLPPPYFISVPYGCWTLAYGSCVLYSSHWHWDNEIPSPPAQGNNRRSRERSSGGRVQILERSPEPVVIDRIEHFVPDAWRLVVCHSSLFVIPRVCHFLVHRFQSIGIRLLSKEIDEHFVCRGWRVAFTLDSFELV